MIFGKVVRKARSVFPDVTLSQDWKNGKIDFPTSGPDRLKIHPNFTKISEWSSVSHTYLDMTNFGHNFFLSHTTLTIRRIESGHFFVLTSAVFQKGSQQTNDTPLYILFSNLKKKEQPTHITVSRELFGFIMPNDNVERRSRSGLIDDSVSSSSSVRSIYPTNSTRFCQPHVRSTLSSNSRRMTAGTSNPTITSDIDARYEHHQGGHRHETLDLDNDSSLGHVIDGGSSVPTCSSMESSLTRVLNIIAPTTHDFGADISTTGNEESIVHGMDDALSVPTCSSMISSAGPSHSIATTSAQPQQRSEVGAWYVHHQDAPSIDGIDNVNDDQSTIPSDDAIGHTGPRIVIPYSSSFLPTVNEMQNENGRVNILPENDPPDGTHQTPSTASVNPGRQGLPTTASPNVVDNEFQTPAHTTTTTVQPTKSKHFSSSLKWHFCLFVGFIVLMVVCYHGLILPVLNKSRGPQNDPVGIVSTTTPPLGTSSRASSDAKTDTTSALLPTFPLSSELTSTMPPTDGPSQALSWEPTPTKAPIKLPSRGPPAEAPSNACTTTTVQTFDEERFLVAKLPNYTLESLKEPNSPQSQAMRWLVCRESSHSTTVQRFALATLYFSIQHQEKLNPDWLSNKHECKWQPSTTSCNRNQECVKLDLSNTLLSGKLPAELSLLSHLTYIRLRSNHLSGTIPSQLGLLRQLTYLHISDSQRLTGTLPTELGQLTNIEWMYLFANQLSGSFPSELGLATDLECLALQSNQFTGKIPNEIGRLTQLTTLSLSQNQFNGTLPTKMGQLSNVQWLYMDSSQLTGTVPTNFSQSSKLAFLCLHDNPFTGQIPEELCNH